MAVVGQVVPEGQQSKEGFHGIRRTTEGLLYYTKVDKDETSSIDFDGGTPTDKNGNPQLPSKEDYTQETTKLQSGATQIFTGDGSTTTFTVTSGATVDDVIVTENGVVQAPTSDYTVSGTTLTFGTAPASGVAIVIRELP